MSGLYLAPILGVPTVGEYYATLNWTQPAPTQVVSLLHMDTSATLDSAEGTPPTWTLLTGGIVSGTSKFGAGSLMGSTTSAAAGAGSIIDLTGSNYTVEMWFMLPSALAGGTYDLFYWNPPSLSGITPIYCAVNSSGSTWSIFAPGVTTGTVTISTNVWHHLAVVLTGYGWTYFLDGVAANSTPYTPSGPNLSGAQTATMEIGTGQFGSGALYIDEVRLSQSALYTANFTPPTSAPGPIATAAVSVPTLLHFDDGANTFIDSAPIPSTWTGHGNAAESVAQSYFGTGSLSLPDATSYITAPLNVGTPLDIATGQPDFQCDYWVYPTSTPAGSTVFVHADFTTNDNPTSGTLFVIGHNASNKLYLVTCGQWCLGGSITGTTAMTMNTWNHVAVVKYHRTVTTYLNGVSQGSLSITGSMPSLPMSGGLAYIGYPAGGIVGGTYLPFTGGYIDEFHLLNGYVTWTSNFTVPDQPWASTPPTGGAPYYSIYRNGSLYASFRNPSFGTSLGPWTDGNVSGGVTYSYYVAASDGMSDQSPDSNMENATIPQGTIIVYGKYAAAPTVMPPLMVANIGNIEPRIYMPQEATTIKG